ncbi:MAG: L-histidine N(alpha)-methyltransferase [Gammaproteobacteria bacterium]|nr:L-histidine N(alpha)-methyltransferase [Gammaproteobacteria bacterium]
MTNEIEALIAGLSKPQKSIAPKYFYDEAGSGLFEEITALPEYYLTSIELGIMESYIDEIATVVGPQASLIEFGSGSSVKTRLLLEHLDELAAYVPVDISEEHLLESQRSIRAAFPHLEVLPVVADFTHPFSLPVPATMPLRNVVYFPGSTIGNFEYDDAVDLLGVMHQEAGDGGALLIGVDLQKDPAVIHDAYNDSAGVTARFNLNMLRHLNREFGSDFELESFRHRATYDPDEGRVVIELVSARQQTVHLGGATILLDEGETILTEYSHKYTLDGFAAMAGVAGFTVSKVWTDPNQWFSVQLLLRD